MDEVIKIVAAALAGALVTAFGYTYKFSVELAALKVQVANLVALMSKPFVIPSEITRQLTEVYTRQTDLEKRVDKLEYGNGQ